MAKTDWSAEITKQKTDWNEGNKNKTNFNEAGEPSAYTLTSTIGFDNVSILFNEGECFFNGPLRTITYSAGKKKTDWT